MAYLPLSERVHVAVAVLSFLYLLPSIVLWVYSLCLCRTKRDPARWAFTWLKVAYPFWIAFLIFYIPNLALGVVLYVEPRFPRSRFNDRLNVNFALARFAWATEHIANIVIFLALVHLGLGILLARTGKQVRLHNIVSSAALAIFAALLVLTIASFGMSMYILREAIAYSGSGSAPSRVVDVQLHGHRLDGFLRIFDFILSIAVLAFAVVVLAKVAKKYEQLKTAAVFLLVCAIQWCIRNFYEFFYFVYFLNFSSLFPIRRTPQYLTVLNFFFGITPTFIILVMLFALGKKKARGLWSMEEHTMKA